MSKLKNILTALNIDEKKSHKFYKETEFNHIKNNVPLVKNYNMMADILFLPTAKLGYKYLFVICDLASGGFDIEPIKDKESDTVLKAMKKCFTREYVKKPYASIKTDGGQEFQGVFHRYLYNESILHTVSLPDRHKSMSMVESLNRQLARLINGYLNTHEKEKNKTFKNWLPAIPVIRTELNAYRKKKTYTREEITQVPYLPFSSSNGKVIQEKGKKPYFGEQQPKFKVGDKVFYKLEVPHTSLYQKQPTTNYREGDTRVSKHSKKIVDIFYYSDQPIYRYKLEGMDNVTYSEKELIKA
jgi:hypothetical protein